MPAITILSPYSGRPVKVREQDLGRAVRDEQGRIFYVVEHPEHGRYAARTRKGSDKELERYQKLEAGEIELEEAASRAAQAAPVHDATGTKRRNPLGTIVLLVLLLLIAAGAYVYFFNPGLIGLGEENGNEAEPAPTENTPGAAAPIDAGAWRGSGLRLLHANNRADRSDLAADEKPYDGFHHTASGLRYKVTHRTDGPLARAGSVVTVRYTAQTLGGESLIDDASQTFVLMSGEAIRALDEGLAGRRAGEQLRLFVPRGHSTTGRLPGIERLPDAAFMMDMQVVAVRPGVSWVVEEPGRADASPAGPGDRVRVHYVLRVEGRDQVIDATAMRGEPMAIALGRGEVIRGLELGLVGMRPGETRTMTIPPYLAYGEREVAGGMIPANSVLSFRVMLVSVVEDEQ